MGYKLTFILAKVKKQAIINWLEGSGGVPSAAAGVFRENGSAGIEDPMWTSSRIESSISHKKRLQ
jgi:hypothetical protein